jgi:nucleotide-binding universal stress UspA family protein
MTASDRVVVGVTGSPASLQALRYAVAEARRRNVPLTAVHAFRAGSAADPTIALPLRDSQFAAALQRLRVWVDEALGSPPADLKLRLTAANGDPVVVLLGQLRSEADLLVVGAGSRRLGGWWGGRVGERCARRATCPVLTAPAPALARELGSHLRLSRRVDHALATELDTLLAQQ